MTSSLVQALSEIDRLLPGTEMEIHTSTSKQALSPKPSLKSARVLTLPHMELEFCNVYRGTLGKTLPLLQRHPDAVVILWNPNDYDHVFFVTPSQLIPCLKQMNADHWSMIVFWSEGSKTRPSTGPDVGLDCTDEPVPLPPHDVPPPQDGAGNDDDMPGPSGYQDPVVPDEDIPHDYLGDDSPDLGGTGGGPFGPGPGPSGNQGENDPDLPSGEIEFLMVHHQRMTMRRILWKFTRSLLLPQDLQMHQGRNNRLPTQIRLFHFRSIHTFRSSSD